MYPLAFHPAPNYADPRIPEKFERWKSRWGKRRTLEEPELFALGRELAATGLVTIDSSGADAYEDRYFPGRDVESVRVADASLVLVSVDAPQYEIILGRTGGAYEGTAHGIARAWPLLRTISRRTKWALWDPRQQAALIGLDMVCTACEHRQPARVDRVCASCGAEVVRGRPIRGVPDELSSEGRTPDRTTMLQNAAHPDEVLAALGDDPIPNDPSVLPMLLLLKDDERLLEVIALVERHAEVLRGNALVDTRLRKLEMLHDDERIQDEARRVRRVLR
ncbi:MAG: hypothetical protein AAGE52_23305 [Myxococcota bacterium]